MAKTRAAALLEFAKYAKKDAWIAVVGSDVDDVYEGELRFWLAQQHNDAFKAGPGGFLDDGNAFNQGQVVVPLRWCSFKELLPNGDRRYTSPQATVSYVLRDALLYVELPAVDAKRTSATISATDVARLEEATAANAYAVAI